jgi:predicted MFS family arabinose efflux permease
VTNPRVERQHYNVTLGILILAGISIALQQTMVVPALPALEREFDTTTAWATWLLTGFLLSASVATPLLGRLGDQYGKERLLLISLLIFFAGSVAAIFAPNIAVLIACRVVQAPAPPSSRSASRSSRTSSHRRRWALRSALFPPCSPSAEASGSFSPE